MKYSDSRTFIGLLHQIPKLSRPYSIFKDFPGPGKMTKFFNDSGHPGRHLPVDYLSISLAKLSQNSG